MNQPNKHRLNTVDAVIDDIIASMPLDDRVRRANLDEDEVLVLQIANAFPGRTLDYKFINSHLSISGTLTNPT